VRIEEDGVLLVSGTTTNGALSSQVYPLVGKRYRLTVTVEGQAELRATTSIPPPADIVYSAREKSKVSTDNIIYAAPFMYVAADVSSITLPIEAPAVWISGHMKFDDGYVDPGVSDLYANSPYLDQFNIAKDAMDVLLRESNTVFERGFIRIQRPALTLALPFTFSMWAVLHYSEYEYDDDGIQKYFELKESYAEQFIVRLIAPSEEYDQYKRSAIKQELAQGIASPFAHDAVRVFSNIDNGVGIFAGYNTTDVAVPINNPYKEWRPIRFPPP